MLSSLRPVLVQTNSLLLFFFCQNQDLIGSGKIKVENPRWLGWVSDDRNSYLPPFGTNDSGHARGGWIDKGIQRSYRATAENLPRKSQATCISRGVCTPEIPLLNCSLWKCWKALIGKPGALAEPLWEDSSESCSGCTDVRVRISDHHPVRYVSIRTGNWDSAGAIRELRDQRHAFPETRGQDQQWLSGPGAGAIAAVTTRWRVAGDIYMSILRANDAHDMRRAACL